MILKSIDTQNKAIVIVIISSILLMTGTIVPLNQANASPPFNIKDFKIIQFGVKNHNPFVVVPGKAGGSKGDVSADFELGYVFHTNKGKFGAFSDEPGKQLLSSHFTEKKVNGHTCLDKVTSTGHVVTSGHTLTIKGINIEKVNKVLTERVLVGEDLGPDNQGHDTGLNTCTDKIFN